eukprot:2815180-Pleurochrysis_carterae.AAC.5
MRKVFKKVKSNARVVRRRTRARDVCAHAPLQRELVHRVCVGHVGDGKEEERGARRRGRVSLSRLVEPRRRRLGDRLLLRNLVGEALRRGEHVDRRLVVQDVALALGQHLQDPVLDLRKLPFVVRSLEEQLALLLLQLGPLLGHNKAEQLVFQPLWRDHKVEQRHLDRDFG